MKERRRGMQDEDRRERRDRIVEEKRPTGAHLESSFEVAHVTWTRTVEEREPVELGQASEPMN